MKEKAKGLIRPRNRSLQIIEVPYNANGYLMNKHDIGKLFAFIGMVASFLAATGFLVRFVWLKIEKAIESQQCAESPRCMHCSEYTFDELWILLMILCIGLGFLSLWLWKKVKEKEEMDGLPPI